MKFTKLRIALLAVGVILAAGGVTAWYFVNSLDRRVAEIIEREGSALTGTKVRVSSVSISLKEGAVTIRGLRVANPDGYSSDDAIRFDSIGLTIDTGSIRRNPIAIKDMVLGSPRIKLEMTEAGKSNLDELRRRVEKNSGRPPDPDPLRLRILQLTAPGGEVEADLSRVGGTVQDLKLDTIRRSNVGGKGGATTDEVAKLLVTAIGKETTKAASKAGLASYLNKPLGGEAGKLKDRVKSVFK